MRQYINKGLILSLIISLGIFNQACDNKAKSLARAEDDFAQGLLSTTKIVAEAKQSNLLSQEDIDLLKPILREVAETHLQIIKLTKESLQFDKELPEDKRALILSLVSFISDRLTELNNEGVLRIKNVEKRLLFNTIVLSMQGSVVIVIQILELRKS